MIMLRSYRSGEHRPERVCDSELQILDGKCLKVNPGISRIKLKDYMLINGFTRIGNEFTKDGFEGLPYSHPCYHVFVNLDLEGDVFIKFENGNGMPTVDSRSSMRQDFYEYKSAEHLFSELKCEAELFFGRGCGLAKLEDAHPEPSLQNKSRKERKKRKQTERGVLKGKVNMLRIKAENADNDAIVETPVTKKFIGYQEQLKDPKWMAFRQFVMVVRGRRCEVCGTEYGLQVHHLRYKENALAWEYTCNDVMVVCGKCHKKIHKIK